MLIFSNPVDIHHVGQYRIGVYGYGSFLRFGVFQLTVD